MDLGEIFTLRAKGYAKKIAWLSDNDQVLDIRTTIDNTVATITATEEGESILELQDYLSRRQRVPVVLRTLIINVRKATGQADRFNVTQGEAQKK